MHPQPRSFPEKIAPQRPSASERHAKPIIGSTLAFSALCLMVDCTQRPAIEIAIGNNQSAIAATLEESAGKVREQNGIASATAEGIVKINPRKKINGPRRHCIERVMDTLPDKDLAYTISFTDLSFETRDCVTTHYINAANPEEFTIQSHTVCPERVNPFTIHL